MTIQEQIIQAARNVSIPGMQPINNPFVEVLHIENFTDFLYANLYVGGFYYILYLGVGGTAPHLCSHPGVHQPHSQVPGENRFNEEADQNGSDLAVFAHPLHDDLDVEVRQAYPLLRVLVGAVEFLRMVGARQEHPGLYVRLRHLVHADPPFPPH